MRKSDGAKRLAGFAAALMLVASGCSSGPEPATRGAAETVEPTVAAPVAAGAGHEHFTVLASDIRWLIPPDASGLPTTGVEIALIEGHPFLKGPFTFRLKFQPGARLMPHTHPAEERITVLSGTLNQGQGGTFDQAATEALQPGSFAFRSPGIAHFVWFDEETVLQFNGDGPFGITYVDPADDPRDG